MFLYPYLKHHQWLHTYSCHTPFPPQSKRELKHISTALKVTITVIRAFEAGLAPSPALRDDTQIAVKCRAISANHVRASSLIQGLTVEIQTMARDKGLGVERERKTVDT